MFHKRLLPTVRSFTSSAGVLKRFDTLQSLQTSILSRANENISEDQNRYLEAFKDVFSYTYEASMREIPLLQKLSGKLVAEPRHLTKDAFREVLLLDPPSSMLVPLLEAFQRRETHTAIPKESAMIALRRSLWEADIKNAVKIVDLTTASPQYLELMKSKRNGAILKSFAGVLGGIGGVDVVLRLLDLTPQIGIYGMLLTYFGNLMFFGYLAFGGKLTGKVKDIQWQPGVSSNHKFIHSDEIEMLSRIAEADILLSNNDGFVSDGLKEALEKRGMEPLHPESDIALQEYWLSGGDNFEWVEPDQDPAVIQWMKHVETKKPNLLKADIKWTDQFIAAGDDSAKAPQT